MKWNKILALLLVIAMAMTMLVACGGKDDDDKKDDSDKASASESVKDDGKKEDENKEEEKDDDKEEESKNDAPAKLTEENLIGTWVAEVDLLPLYIENWGEDNFDYDLQELGVEILAEAIIVFEEGEKGTMTEKVEFDADALLKKLKKNDAFIQQYTGKTKEELEQLAKDEWITYEELIEEIFEDKDDILRELDLDDIADAVASIEEWPSESFSYTFDGKTLTMDGETERYSYEGGVLKLKSFSSDELTLEFKKK